MATPLALSTLPIEGATLTGNNSSFANYIPILNSSGQLDSSFISGGGGGSIPFTMPADNSPFLKNHEGSAIIFDDSNGNVKFTGYTSGGTVAATTLGFEASSGNPLITGATSYGVIKIVGVSNTEASIGFKPSGSSDSDPNNWVIGTFIDETNGYFDFWNQGNVVAYIDQSGNIVSASFNTTDGNITIGNSSGAQGYIDDSGNVYGEGTLVINGTGQFNNYLTVTSTAPQIILYNSGGATVKARLNQKNNSEATWSWNVDGDNSDVIDDGTKAAYKLNNDNTTWNVQAMAPGNNLWSTAVTALSYNPTTNLFSVYGAASIPNGLVVGSVSAPIVKDTDGNLIIGTDSHAGVGTSGSPFLQENISGNSNHWGFDQYGNLWPYGNNGEGSTGFIIGDPNLMDSFDIGIGIDLRSSQVYINSGIGGAYINLNTAAHINMVGTGSTISFTAAGTTLSDANTVPGSTFYLPSTSGTLVTVASSNVFNGPQTAPGWFLPNGPVGIVCAISGDSRSAGPQGTAGYSTATAANYNPFGYYDRLGGQFQLSAMGYYTSGYVSNCAVAGTGISSMLAWYAGSSITTTGNITGGSYTITITGSTSGIPTSNNIGVGGTGIPPGTYGSYPGTGTTLTLNNYFELKPSTSITGATLDIYNPTLSGNTGNTMFSSQTPHELSPRISGNTGHFISTTGINDAESTTHNGVTSSTVSTTLTGFSGLGTLTGQSVLSSVLPSNVWIVSNTSTTITVSSLPISNSSGASVVISNYGPNTYTGITTSTVSTTLTGFSGLGNHVGEPVFGSTISTSSNVTVISNTATTITISVAPISNSGSATILIGSGISAWEYNYTQLVNTALADNWNAVIICTVPKAWTGAWNIGDGFRQIWNAWLLSKYGTTPLGNSTYSGSTSTVYVIDTASMPAWATFNTQYYLSDGLHFNTVGEQLWANFILVGINTIFSSTSNEMDIIPGMVNSIPALCVQAPTSFSVNPNGNSGTISIGEYVNTGQSDLNIGGLTIQNNAGTLRLLQGGTVYGNFITSAVAPSWSNTGTNFSYIDAFAPSLTSTQYATFNFGISSARCWYFGYTAGSTATADLFNLGWTLGSSPSPIYAWGSGNISIGANTSSTDPGIAISLLGNTKITGTIDVTSSVTLGNLSSNGLVKTSGGTGLLSIATAGTDYISPSGLGTGVQTALGIAANTVGGIITYPPTATIYSANTTLIPGILSGLNTSSASHTFLLPSSPTNGMIIQVFDPAKTWSTNTAVIGTSSNTFYSPSAPTGVVGPYNLNVTPSIPGIISFIYDSSISAWSVN